MAVTHSTSAKNAATNAVTALLGVSGNLVFRLAGDVVSPGTAVATLPLSVDAFQDAVDGVADANAITSDENATGNASPIATMTLQTSAGVVHIHAEVAASGSDVDFANGLVIGAGDTVEVESLSYSALSS